MIRPAGPADAGAVHAVTQAAFAAQAALDPPSGALRETPAGVAEDLASHGGFVHLDAAGAVDAAVRLAGDPPVQWFRRLAVHPQAQGRGLGAALVAAVAAEAAARGRTALRCGVRTAVAGNLAFYRRLGFTPVQDKDFWHVLGHPLPRRIERPGDMHALGVRLAAVLAEGDLVLLAGPLGAGKTVLAQGIGAGLGVAGRVTSPTFVLSRRHPGPRLDLLHADAYRLGAAAELDDLDLDSELAGAVAVVEWGQGLAEGLAEGHLLVSFERVDPTDVRLLTLAGRGPGWSARQDVLDTAV